MRTLILSVAVSVLAVSPAVAAAPLKRERTTYLHQYFKVRAMHGKRAPGRQILREGVRRNGHVSAATARQVATSIRHLRALTIPLLAPAPPRQAPSAVLTARAPAGGNLAAIRACESGGNYSTNTGNGFYGAYQFDQGTWNSVGGSGNPASASPAEQDKRAAMLHAQRGSAPWPVCGR